MLPFPPALLTAPAAPVWAWPVPPPVRIIRRYAPPPLPWLPGHRGVDLAAAPGDPVHATGPGRITFARDLAGRGVITITHGQLRTTYEPVTPSLPEGTPVTTATMIGTLETGSHCTTPCLHWGLRRGPTYLNPFTLLTHPTIRLLPHR
ncbi:hypothetical protein GCM10027589_28590 [Actinocorallia lasiicapitis]